MGMDTRHAFTLAIGLAFGSNAFAGDPPDPACSARVFDAVVDQADTNADVAREAWREAHRQHYSDTDWDALRATAPAAEVNDIRRREQESAERVRDLRDDYRDAKYHARQVRRDPAIAAAACREWTRLYGTTASSGTSPTAAAEADLRPTSNTTDD